MFTCRLVLAFVLGVTAVLALPPLQHSINGVVHAVDVAKHTLTLEAEKKDGPTEFDIVEGRTRLRHDGKPAALGDLTPGQVVHLYYKLEMGRQVATEVTWTTGGKPKDKT